MTMRNVMAVILEVVVIVLWTSGCGALPGPTGEPALPAAREPMNAISPATYEEECERADCYRGLEAFVDGFALDSYDCVYVGQRVVIWVVETEAAETYVTEGAKVDEAIGDLEGYLNASLNDLYREAERVHVFYGSTWAAFTPVDRYAKPVIFMPLASDPHSFHNYAHELTHLLTPQHTDWASEGLAVYLNDRWAGEGGYPNYGADIDQLAKSYTSRLEILGNIGDETYYPSRSDLTTSVGLGFYVLSGSFVKYLVEKTGIETFMQIYYAPDMQGGLDTLTQRTLQEWKTEWLSYLSTLQE